MNFNVYLSGGIAGKTYDQIVGWRNELRPLVDSGVRLISPMRGKEHLSSVKKFHKVIADNKVVDDIMANGKSIFTRDLFDVKNSEVVLFNALDCKAVSIGSVCEVAWAWQLGKIVILVIEEDKKNPHDHDFIHTMAHYTVHNLEDAAHVINQIFIGYRK